MSTAKKRKRKEALSMNDELTAQDIQKMQAELDDRPSPSDAGAD